MAKLTEMPHPVSYRIMNPSDKGPECYNSQCICTNNGEPRGEQGDVIQSV